MSVFGDIFARSGAVSLDPLESILAMPRAVYDSESHAGLALQAQIRRDRASPHLRPVQVAALLAAVDLRTADADAPEGPRGLVAMVGCGHGKTIIGQLMPQVFGSRNPLFFMPAALKTQYARENAFWGRHLYLASVQDRIASYELLSQPAQSDALFRYKPDLLVLDEAHLLSNPDSARWKRISRYLEERQYDCRVVVLSGTLTCRSIFEMQHLLYAALRDFSPLPTDSSLAAWSNCLDLGGEPSAQDTFYMAKLARWADQTGTKTGLRHAFRERLRTTRGLVLSESKSAEVSLRIRLWKGPPQPASVETALGDVATKWVLPDGLELVDALETDRAFRQLAFGYFSRWVEGTGHPRWFDLRRTWGAIVRSRVIYGGFDSPALVAEAALAGRLTARERAAYVDWVDTEDQSPDREFVWLDGGMQYIRSVSESYFDRFGIDDTLFWFQSRPVGQALSDRMSYHGNASLPPCGGSAAVSSKVHGKGWNGQAYSRNCILEVPTSAATWEQLLSRTHRPGQMCDVDVTVFTPTEHARTCFFKAIEGAKYIQDTTGEPQRLLFADKEG